MDPAAPTVDPNETQPLKVEIPVALKPGTVTFFVVLIPPAVDAQVPAEPTDPPVPFTHEFQLNFKTSPLLGDDKVTSVSPLRVDDPPPPAP